MEEHNELMELCRKFQELEDSCPEDFPFCLSFGDKLCLDGSFTKDELLVLANLILKVFGDG